MTWTFFTVQGTWTVWWWYIMKLLVIMAIIIGYDVWSWWWWLFPNIKTALLKTGKLHFPVSVFNTPTKLQGTIFFKLYKTTSPAVSCVYEVWKWVHWGVLSCVSVRAVKVLYTLICFPSFLRTARCLWMCSVQLLLFIIAARLQLCSRIGCL